MHAQPTRTLTPRGDLPHPAGDAAGASRFNVVFSRTAGSRKQRAKREGALVVRHDVAYLYDTDNKECVLRCKASGAGPNAVFARMQKAHRGADWRVGTELSLCGFDVVVEEVMALHLIPYDEDVDAAAASESEGRETESAAAAATHGAGGSLRWIRSAPSLTPVLTQRPAAATTVPAPPLADGAAQLASHTSALEDAVASSSLRRSRDDGGASVQAAPQQPTCRPRRRRSTASLARELRRCYPQHF